MVFVVVEIFRPLNVSGEGAGHLGVLEGLVVGVYGERGLAGFKVDSPLTDGFNNGKHFSVSNALVKF